MGSGVDAQGCCDGNDLYVCIDENSGTPVLTECAMNSCP
jgi:hypothetical protein